MSNSSTENGDTSPERCWELINTGVTPQPDNDISGIGVIIAFMASAYITLLLVLTAYILGYVDTSLLRPVDTLVHNRRGSSMSTQHQKPHTPVVMFRQTVLAFSDQQIVTGIAILIAGFARFASAMNVYHFQMVIYLAWMSSSTHLSALTMLSAFLRERRLLLAWRIVGMLLLFIFLLVAMVPTWPNLWAIDLTSGDETTGWGIPAKCFWLRTYGSGVNPDAPIGCLILLGSYVWKICSIFHSSRTFFHRWVRGPTEYFLERLLRREALRVKSQGSTTGFRCRYRATVALYSILVSQFEFLSSFAASLWMSVGGLAWGTVQILVPRGQNNWWAWQENTWTFGQVTPLVLLIQPLGSALEHIHKHHLHGGGGGGGGHVVDDDSESATVDLELESSGSTIRRHNRFWPNTRFHRPSRSNSGRKRRRPSKPRRGSLAGTKNKTLLDVFSTLEVRTPENRVIGDLPGHQRIMYNSRYFKGLFWWIQFWALVAISCICGFDGANIGIDTSSTWLFICLVAVAGLVANGLWSLALMPFSRVFV